MGMGDEAPRPSPSSVRDREASVDQFTGHADMEAENPYPARDSPLLPIDREIGQQDLDERSKYLTERVLLRQRRSK
jgi:hypothetical protein